MADIGTSTPKLLAEHKSPHGEINRGPVSTGVSQDSHSTKRNADISTSQTDASAVKVSRPSNSLAEIPNDTRHLNAASLPQSLGTPSSSRRQSLPSAKSGGTQNDRLGGSSPSVAIMSPTTGASSDVVKKRGRPLKEAGTCTITSAAQTAAIMPIDRTASTSLLATNPQEVAEGSLKPKKPRAPRGMGPKSLKRKAEAERQERETALAAAASVAAASATKNDQTLVFKQPAFQAATHPTPHQLGSLTSTLASANGTILKSAAASQATSMNISAKADESVNASGKTDAGLNNRAIYPAQTKTSAIKVGLGCPSASISHDLNSSRSNTTSVVSSQPASANVSAYPFINQATGNRISKAPKSANGRRFDPIHSSTGALPALNTVYTSTSLSNKVPIRSHDHARSPSQPQDKDKQRISSPPRTRPPGTSEAGGSGISNDPASKRVQAVQSGFATRAVQGSADDKVQNSLSSSKRVKISSPPKQIASSPLLPKSLPASSPSTKPTAAPGSPRIAAVNDGKDYTDLYKKPAHIVPPLKQAVRSPDLMALDNVEALTDNARPSAGPVSMTTLKEREVSDVTGDKKNESGASRSPKSARLPSTRDNLSLALTSTGSGLLSSTIFGQQNPAHELEAGHDTTRAIMIDIPLGKEPLYFNFARLAEEKYGFDTLYPRVAAQRRQLARIAAASDALEKTTAKGSTGTNPEISISDDQHSVDLSNDEGDHSNVEMGDGELNETNVANEPDRSATLGQGDDQQEQKQKRKQRRKRVMKEDMYDIDDDFVDDAELAWQEQAAVAQDGFFVYAGPLVLENATLDKHENGKENSRGGRAGHRARSNKNDLSNSGTAQDTKKLKDKSRDGPSEGKSNEKKSSNKDKNSAKTKDCNSKVKSKASKVSSSDKNRSKEHGVANSTDKTSAKQPQQTIATSGNSRLPSPTDFHVMQPTVSAKTPQKTKPGAQGNVKISKKPDTLPMAPVARDAATEALESSANPQKEVLHSASNPAETDPKTLHPATASTIFVQNIDADHRMTE